MKTKVYMNGWGRLVPIPKDKEYIDVRNEDWYQEKQKHNYTYRYPPYYPSKYPNSSLIQKKVKHGNDVNKSFIDFIGD